MKRIQWLSLVTVSFAAAASLLLLAACELEGVDSVAREVGVDFSGVYDGIDPEPLVSPPNSGSRVTRLNLIQSGDQLQATDNNNYVFYGTIGESRGADSGSAQASFTLQGKTTAGQAVTIAGTLAGSGSSATMRGTWMEPGIYAIVNGDAIINQIQSNQQYTLSVTVSPSAGGSVSPSGGSYDNGDDVTLTATANSGYSFSYWSGALSGSANPSTVTISGDTSVQANFVTNSP